jgi:hypothetical protein
MTMPGKWGLHRFYSKDLFLRDYLPPTAIYRHETLKRFIQQYRSVYIKPNMEHTGKGIIKAWRGEKGYTFVKVTGKSAPWLPTVQALFQKLQIDRSQVHVIQKSINLARFNGRIFDIRTMMMRDKKNQWRYMGILAKIAGENSVVTNVRRGHGYAMEAEQVLTKCFNKTRALSMIQSMKELSFRICKRFDSYKFSCQIGIDFGVDQSGRVWIIEVNFDYPSHVLFAKLKDKTMYRKIQAFELNDRKKAWRG